MPFDIEKYANDLSARVPAIVASAVESALERFQGSTTTSDAPVAGIPTESGPAPQAGAATLSVPCQSNHLVGQIVLAQAVANGDPERAAAFAEKEWGKGSEPYNALVSHTAEDGGVLIPDDVHSQYIEELTPRVAVLAHRPIELPMPGGQMTVPKVAGGTTAHYQGEGEDATPSQPKVKDRSMTARTLVTLVPVSNKLRERARSGRLGFNVDRFVQTMAIKYSALRMNLALLRDDGTNNTPKGLREWVLPNNLLPFAGAATFDNVLAFLASMIEALEGSDVGMARPGWIVSSRIKNFLMYRTITDGKPFFLEEMRAGSLLGIPFVSSNQVPNNLGGGGNESEIYLADFDELYLGREGGIKVAVSQDGSYVENGAIRSAFSRDETLVRLTESHDFMPSHDEAVAVGTGVTWGA